MLWTASSIIGYTVAATDGAIGSLSDFLFDDTTWILRWAVADTGERLSGRPALLPPTRLAPPDPASRVLAVDLTRHQVELSPDTTADPPVSRQQEEMIYRYYGWEPYWAAGYAASAGLATPPVQPALYGDLRHCPRATRHCAASPR